MSYNNNYNYWIEGLLAGFDRKAVEVTFAPHALDRKEYYNLDLDKVEEAVRAGRVKLDKCKEPDKLCFEMYFGKENMTYCVIAVFHNEFIEVKTIWQRKGR